MISKRDLETGCCGILGILILVVIVGMIRWKEDEKVHVKKEEAARQEASQKKYQEQRSKIDSYVPSLLGSKKASPELGSAFHPDSYESFLTKFPSPEEMEQAIGPADKHRGNRLTWGSDYLNAEYRNNKLFKINYGDKEITKDSVKRPDFNSPYTHF